MSAIVRLTCSVLDNLHMFYVCGEQQVSGSSPMRKLLIGTLLVIALVIFVLPTLAQADPSSSFSANSSAICDGASGITVYVRTNAYWTMTIYRDYQTNSVVGSYNSSSANLTDVLWTSGSFALDSNNRWSEWDKMWIGADSSGVFVTQHFIEFDCTGKAAGEPAAVYICNDFTGNDPFVCRQPSGVTIYGFHNKFTKSNEILSATPVDY